MKKILGLDLGTTSIGWALVYEGESKKERSSIVKLGVRVNPLTVDEQSNFTKGKEITTNSARTLKRGMRRNLQRYKLRRHTLLDVLKKARFINSATVLCEQQLIPAGDTRLLSGDFIYVLTENEHIEELSQMVGE